jgi:hypothetical protein
MRVADWESPATDGFAYKTANGTLHVSRNRREAGWR